MTSEVPLCINAEPHHSPDVFPALKQHIGMLDIVNHVSCKSCVTAEVEKATAGDRGLAQKSSLWHGMPSRQTGKHGRALSHGAQSMPDCCLTGMHPYPRTCIMSFAYLGSNEAVKQSIFRHRVSMMGNGELLELDLTTVATGSFPL